MSAEILDPNSERGQQAIRNAAYLKPTTQGDPPPRPDFDGWAQDIASLRENLGFDNYVALIAEALATAYDQRGKDAASVPSRPLEALIERSISRWREYAHAANMQQTSPQAFRLCALELETAFRVLVPGGDPQE